MGRAGRERRPQGVVGRSRRRDGSQVAVLRHPALEGLDHYSGPRLAEVRVTDRVRIAVLMQGAALLSHLRNAGWCLAAGWEGARVSRGGRLRVPGCEPGRSGRSDASCLRDLVQRLFGPPTAIGGRGAGQIAARRLLEDWQPSLRPADADRSVAQVLETAPFLWERRYGSAREALAGEVDRGGAAVLWVAGPGGFRRRVLARAETLDDAWRLVGSERAASLWQGEAVDTDPAVLAAQGRYRAAVLAWESRPLPAKGEAAERRHRAIAWLALGAFDKALAVLGVHHDVDSDLLRARLQILLSRLGGARRTVQRLAGRSLTAAQAVDLAQIGIRLSGLSLDGDKHRDWVARAMAATRRAAPLERWRARLLAAGAAWDHGDLPAAGRHLEASARLASDPADGWRWAQVRALVDSSSGDAAAAVRGLTEALGRDRRRLYRHHAAALWNDLGLARAAADDLAGAERAFGHSLRLYRGCGGSRSLTLGEVNLAEIRLRRGRLLGVRQILERSTASNELAGNLRGGAYDATLWARYQLLQGRPREALECCRSILEKLAAARLEDQVEELRLLAARALGWLGRGTEAAAELDHVGAPALAALEPEERPAVFALAGRLGAAADLAAETRVAALWLALLSGRTPSPEDWQALEALEPYRAARVVYDCDRYVAGSVPSHLLRRAVAALRRVGASRAARDLEARDHGPWTAMCAYLGREPGDGEALTELFAEAGYPRARVVWLGDDDARVVVAGAGGDQQLAAPLAGGTLELYAPAIDPALSALFRLALRDLPGPAGAAETGDGLTEPETSAPAERSHGIVGQDPQVLAALERVRRIAPGPLPLLIHGESGTGKELFARYAHRSSARSDGPFVPINCAALSESLLLSELFGHVRGAFTGADRDRDGVFQAARGGTVFLDEIGDLPPSAQGMLLRVLQESEVRRVGESVASPVDVRVVAATHRDLEAMSREGAFRQDLFYRLHGAQVRLPPLRDRGQDILRLAEHLLAGGAAAGERPPRLTAAARTRLLGHGWPGNVRELQNVLGVAVALAGDGLIGVEQLELGEAPGVTGSSSYHQRLQAFKTELVREALRAAGGNQSEAARRLDLSRQAMSYLVRSLGIR